MKIKIEEVEIGQIVSVGWVEGGENFLAYGEISDIKKDSIILAFNYFENILIDCISIKKPSIVKVEYI